MAKGFAAAELHLLPGAPLFHSADSFRFPYDELPGGRDGLYIPADHIQHIFQPYMWDCRGFLAGTGPIIPYRPDRVNPQSRCDLNLEVIVTEARWRGYHDIEFLEEMFHIGIHNRGALWRDILLCPPYQGLFSSDKFQFMFSKNMEKRAKVPPRFEGPYRLPPFLGCYCCPVNVAIRMSDGKLRVTRDFGAPRNLDTSGLRPLTPFPANTPGPLSLNARLPLLDKVAFPDIEMLSVPSLMRQVAELASIRACFPNEPLPPSLYITKFKADYAAFYETLCRCATCDNVQLQFSFAGGFEIDPRLIFAAIWVGFYAIPHVTGTPPIPTFRRQPQQYGHSTHSDVPSPPSTFGHSTHSDVPSPPSTYGHSTHSDFPSPPLTLRALHP